MPTSNLQPMSYDSDGLILATSGYDLLTAVQTLDDSKFVYNDTLPSSAFHSSVRYAPQTGIIPLTATIDTATIHFRANTDLFSHNPFQCNESTWFVNQDTFVSNGVWADYYVTADPTGTTGADVASVRCFFNFPNGNAPPYAIAPSSMLCSFFEWIVDWTPAPSGRISTWVAPAWPNTCGVPPLRYFKPFDLIDRTTTSPADVTALYAHRFGQPPSGYLIWVIWRALEDTLWPNADSPIEGYIVP